MAVVFERDARSFTHLFNDVVITLRDGEGNDLPVGVDVYVDVENHPFVWLVCGSKDRTEMLSDRMPTDAKECRLLITHILLNAAEMSGAVVGSARRSNGALIARFDVRPASERGGDDI